MIIELINNEDHQIIQLSKNNQELLNKSQVVPSIGDIIDLHDGCNYIVTSRKISIKEGFDTMLICFVDVNSSFRDMFNNHGL